MMKESNITSVLVKSKMSGYEVGRLMIQSYLYDLKQICEGSKEPQGLLNLQEVQYVQDQLKDSNDIKIYNSCRRLFEYLTHAANLATIAKKELDIIALKLYMLIPNELNAKRRYKNDEIIIELMDEFITLLKQWFIFNESFKLISERMELPDLMILINENPMSRVAQVNALLKDLQFLYPGNEVSKVLVSKGMEHACEEGEALQNADIIEVGKLKPTTERINAARDAIKDLTYFKNNYGLHTVLEG